jgi:AAA domain
MKCIKQWLVRDMLGLDEFSVFFGEPGSGKSVLIEDLHLHAAARLDWHGRTTQGGLAVYVALERPQLVERRALAFRVRTGLADIPCALVPGPINFMDKAAAALVLDIIHKAEDFFGLKLTLLGIDTVSAALCGGDENSPKDMGAVVSTIRRIQEGVTAHILAAHHQPQDAPRLRGHGALLGAVDTTIEVNGNGGGIRTAVVRKANDGAPGEQVSFTLESVSIGEDTTASIVVPAEGVSHATAAGKTPRLSPTAKIALNALREAVDDIGKVPEQHPHIADNIKAVTVKQWREHCYKRGISEGEERARQKAFDRAMTTLAAAKFIGIWEPFVWPAKQ